MRICMRIRHAGVSVLPPPPPVGRALAARGWPAGPGHAQFGSHCPLWVDPGGDESVIRGSNKELRRKENDGPSEKTRRGYKN